MVSPLGCLLNAGCEVSPRGAALQRELQLIFSVGAPASPPGAESAPTHHALMRTTLSTTTELWSCWLQKGQHLMLFEKVSSSSFVIESSPI